MPCGLEARYAHRSRVLGEEKAASKAGFLCYCSRSQILRTIACIAAGRWRDAAACSTRLTRITKGEHLIRDLIRENTALRRLYYRTRLLRPASESDERQILASLTKGAPKTFVEFGFHPIEFNCVDFAKNPEWVRPPDRRQQAAGR